MLQPFYSTNQSTTPSINESIKQSFPALNKFKNKKVINYKIIDLFLGATTLVAKLSATFKNPILETMELPVTSRFLR